MRAMVLSRFGDPDVLSLGEVAGPVPRPDQILLKVAACGVCGHDLLNRRGQFPHTKLPAVLGHEIAGTVVEIGALVKKFKVGDRVAVTPSIPCGLCVLCRSGQENSCLSGPGLYGEGTSGGYGEYVIATERSAARVPEHVPLHIAAVLGCAIGTGFHALRRAGLRLGDTVVITAASGGVGIHTVMLARLMGLRSIAISSSAVKAERLHAAGASEVIVAPDFSFYERVRSLTSGEGADAVIEIAGARTFHSSIRSLRIGGRMVVVGNVEPGTVPINPALLILKELALIGSGHATLDDLEKVIMLVARGDIVPEIAASLPIEDVSTAHRIMEDQSTVGRVLLLHG